MSVTQTQVASIAGTTDSYPSALRAESAHWTCVGLYGGLCGIGAVHTEAGLILLAAFACISSLGVLFRNRVMLGIMALAGLFSVVFPPVGVVLMLVAALLLIFRIMFIVENIRVIALGLLVYGAAIIVMISALDVTRAVLDWVAVTSLRQGSSPEVIAGVVVGSMSAALMHDVLTSAYRRGYSTSNALQIMSMIPLLVLSLVLPFLKLHFDLGIPTEPGVPLGSGLHHGPVDFHGVAPGGGVASEVAFGHAVGSGGLAHALHAPGSHGVPHVPLNSHPVAHGPASFIGTGADLHEHPPAFPQTGLGDDPPQPFAHAPSPPEPLPVPHTPASPPLAAPEWHPSAPVAPTSPSAASPPLMTTMSTPQGLITVNRLGGHTDFQPLAGGEAAHASLHHNVGQGDVVTHGGIKVGYIADSPADHSFHAGTSPIGGAQPWVDGAGIHHVPGLSGLDIALVHKVNGQWHVTDLRPNPQMFLPQSGALSLNEVLVGLGIR